MIKLTYGEGKFKTQQGHIEGEGKCLTLTESDIVRPIGATELTYPPSIPQEDHDVVIVFKTLESARVLQDQLNELISIWAREESVKIEE